MTVAMNILQRPNVKMAYTNDVPQTKVACIESNQANDWANSVLVMSMQGLLFILMYQKLVIRVVEYTKVIIFLHSFFFTIELWVQKICSILKEKLFKSCSLHFQMYLHSSKCLYLS